MKLQNMFFTEELNEVFGKDDAKMAAYMQVAMGINLESAEEISVLNKKELDLYIEYKEAFDVLSDKSRTPYFREWAELNRLTTKIMNLIDGINKDLEIFRNKQN